MYDLLIKKGTIADGSGKQLCYSADVAVLDGKIVRISRNIEGEAKRIINAEGLIVSPGFIDNHSHSDFSILLDPNFANVVEQGITTEVVGNCGGTIAPMLYQDAKSLAMAYGFAGDHLEEFSKQLETFSGYIELLETRKLGDNWAFYVGHGTIRAFVMGNEKRPPSKSELEIMKRLMRDAMESGALGLTTGLIYPPGSCAEMEELVELSKVVAEYGGSYCTHLRSEGNNLIEAIKEAIEIGKRAGLPVNISHLKIKGKRNWHKLQSVFDVIDQARIPGMKISADMYPYLASATTLTSALPVKFSSGGIEKLVERLKNKDFRNNVRKEILSGSGSEGAIEHSGYEGILILTALYTPEVEGKTIAVIADERREDPLETMCNIIVENMGTCIAGYFAQNDENLTEIFKKPYVMGGTDGGAMSSVNPLIHPRQVGTFPRLVRRFVRDQKIFCIEAIVHKLSGFPAGVLGFKSKGQIKEGFDADIIVFDLEKLADHASFSDPKAKNEGMIYVIVNGQVTVENETFTGIHAGKLLRKR